MTDSYSPLMPWLRAVDRMVRHQFADAFEGHEPESRAAARERTTEISHQLRDRITGAVSAEDYATTVATLEAIARELGWDDARAEFAPHRRGFGPRGRHGFGPRGFGGFGPGFGGFGPRGFGGFGPQFGPFGPGFRAGRGRHGFDPRDGACSSPAADEAAQA